MSEGVHVFFDCPCRRKQPRGVHLGGVLEEVSLHIDVLNLGLNVIELLGLCELTTVSEASVNDLAAARNDEEFQLTTEVNV